MSTQDDFGNLGELEPNVGRALEELQQQRVLARIWQRDHTLWQPGPEEISNRLGWLESPASMAGHIDPILEFVEEVRTAGFTQALLLGMGGSSLAPELFRLSFGVQEGYLELAVLDSTDPGAVLAVDRKLDPARTLYIVSTKSGGTVETLSFFKYFYTRAVATLGRDNAGRHFAAITDPGSKLAEIAAQLGFRQTFLNDPNIGGRFSALSCFGLMPAALTGVDVRKLLAIAAERATGCDAPAGNVADKNSGAWFGAVLGEAARAGRDKLTLFTSPALRYFGAWAEQLVAESTGKEGKGILPVDGETPGEPGRYGADRLFVYLRLQDDATLDAQVRALLAAGHPVVQFCLRSLYDLGSEFFRWELATSVAGWRLGVNPFDQPNVESAKVQARKMVAEFIESGRLPELSPRFEEHGIRVFTDGTADSLQSALAGFLAPAAETPGHYVALQAYVPPAADTSRGLQALRMRIAEKHRVATSVGYGPRFLHSTGQLHKGDAGNGLFIQFTADLPEDVGIPDQPGEAAASMTFGVLETAQALGDRQALLDAGRPVVRFHLGADVVAGLGRLAELV